MVVEIASTRSVAGARTVPDIGSIADVRTVSHTGAVPNVRTVADVRSVANPGAVADIRSIAHARPIADVWSVSAAGALGGKLSDVGSSGRSIGEKIGGGSAAISATLSDSSWKRRGAARAPCPGKIKELI